MSTRSTPVGAGEPLPPYRALLAVDTERFSRNPSARLPGLSALLPEVLQQAMSACDLDEIWRRRRFAQATGDGYVLGTESEYAPFLLDPFLDSLQDELERQDRSLRSEDRRLRLRLRVSVHLGPVPDSGDELRDRVSTPTNETFRLLDAAPTRRALTSSNPDITLMAAIVSQRVFEDVVLAGYTGLHQDRFEPVTAELRNKDFARPAWLYVPRPSRRPPGTDGDGSVGADGERGSAAPAGSPGPGRGTVVAPVFNGQVGSSVVSDQVNGGVNPRFDRDSFGARGADRE